MFSFRRNIHENLSDDSSRNKTNSITVYANDRQISSTESYHNCNPDFMRVVNVADGEFQGA